MGQAVSADSDYTSDCLKDISVEQVAKLVIDGQLVINNNVFTKFIIIDARFNYEYDGGHIKGKFFSRTKNKKWFRCPQLFQRVECSAETPFGTIIYCRIFVKINLGAINVPKVEANQWQESLRSQFFASENEDKIHNDYLIIFHCEFSSKRGPDLRAWFRKKDRSSNVSTFMVFHVHLWCL